jgi:hypothetical protein
MILVSGPAIAKLVMRTRKSAHEHIRRGSYGTVREIDGVLYAELGSIEARLGRTFSPEQLELARDGKPGRVLTVLEMEPANG